MSIPADRLEALRNELERIEEDCKHSSKAHYNAASRWVGWNYRIGIPPVVLSALAGTAFAKEFGVWAAILSVAATVLSALMAFLKPAQVATEHRNAGGQYLTLRNNTRLFLEIQLPRIENEDEAVKAITQLATRRNELNQASRPFAEQDFRKAKEGVDRGEATYAVDAGRAR